MITPAYVNVVEISGDLAYSAEREGILSAVRCRNAGASGTVLFGPNTVGMEAV